MNVTYVTLVQMEYDDVRQIAMLILDPQSNGNALSVPCVEMLRSTMQSKLDGQRC